MEGYLNCLGTPNVVIQAQVFDLCSTSNAKRRIPCPVRSPAKHHADQCIVVF